MNDDISQYLAEFIRTWRAKTPDLVWVEGATIDKIPGVVEQRFLLTHAADQRLHQHEQRQASVVVTMRRGHDFFVVTTLGRELDLPTDPETVDRVIRQLSDDLLQQVQLNGEVPPP